MIRFLRRADDVLRRRPWTTESSPASAAFFQLTAFILIFGMEYGAVMGIFGGLFGERIWQVVYSAVKVPMLLLVTFGLGLPSYFVLYSLLGLRRDFVPAVRALAATQAGLTIILASLSPITAFWYASSANYQAAVLFNALIFAIATIGAQWLLRGYYQPLIARNRKNRWLLWTWVIIYAFVGIQMGWILRPFVGVPDNPVQFFREDAFEQNAYQVVAKLIWQMLEP